VRLRRRLLGRDSLLKIFHLALELSGLALRSIALSRRFVETLARVRELPQGIGFLVFEGGDRAFQVGVRRLLAFEQTRLVA